MSFKCASCNRASNYVNKKLTELKDKFVIIAGNNTPH